MSLIVEDGTGLPDAESYASVAQFKDYHLKRGNTVASDLDDDAIEPLLRQATDFLVEMYRQVWLGEIIKPTQALDWPRNFVPIPGYNDHHRQHNVVYGYGNVFYGHPLPSYMPNNAVPKEVIKACVILADKARSGPLAADQKRLVAKQVIGPIQTEYVAGAPTLTVYTEIQRLLTPLIDSSANGFNVKLERC
jgi:hypothetical protein